MGRDLSVYSLSNSTQCPGKSRRRKAREGCVCVCVGASEGRAHFRLPHSRSVLCPTSATSPRGAGATGLGHCRGGAQWEGVHRYLHLSPLFHLVPQDRNKNNGFGDMFNYGPVFILQGASAFPASQAGKLSPRAATVYPRLYSKCASRAGF